MEALYAQQASSSLQAGLAALSFVSGPTVGAFLLAIGNRPASSARLSPGSLGVAGAARERRKLSK